MKTGSITVVYETPGGASLSHSYEGDYSLQVTDGLLSIQEAPKDGKYHITSIPLHRVIHIDQYREK